ncbi:MAG: DUF4386 domain-containing protein [Caldilineaceae bacterium]
MNTQQFRKVTGLLFILGAILVNIPYALLISNFNYPDILREPASTILTQFQAGGAPLIFTWLAFAWVGLPLIFGTLMLKRVLEPEGHPLLETATTLGLVSLVLAVVGLTRWVFVVPGLAQLYTDPNSSEAVRAAAIVTFQAVHQYGGVVIGEHISQFMTVLWMVLISSMMLRSSVFQAWQGWLGFGAALVYLLAQSELLATAIPSFPEVPAAGLIGSLLWLLWMIVMGVSLLRSRPESALQSTRPVAVAGMPTH